MSRENTPVSSATARAEEIEAVRFPLTPQPDAILPA
jgi:hypothetical protein